MNARMKRSPQRSRHRGLLALALALLLVPFAPVAAHAAPGDYTMTLAGPETVPLAQGISYDVTLEVDATAATPAEGIVLTSVLPEGLDFLSVPIGGSSPVESYTYDPATRTVVFTMRSLTEQLIGFTYAVRQVENAVKDQNTTFTTTISGSETPSGTTPSDSVTTRVTGNNDYFPTKTHTVVPATGNRVVTYAFNVGTTHGYESDTFTSWAQRLTDVLPAGAVVRDSSTGWSFTTAPDGSTQAVWERTGQYGRSNTTLVGAGTGIWITVEYPSEAFPEGSPPPTNVVELDTMDHSGTWHEQVDASTQGPELSDGKVVAQIAIIKGAELGLDSMAANSGIWLSLFTTTASYLNSLTDDDLESLTVTDAASQSADNAAVWDHIDTYRLHVRFNGVLREADLPYTIEYQTNLAPGTWQTFTPDTPRTRANTGLYVQTVGSTDFATDSHTQPLDLPVGAHLTGWRIVVSPDAETSVPTGSEVTITTSIVGSHTSLSGGAPATDPLVNTATATGTTTAGDALAASDPLAITVADRVNLITDIVAPSALAVGGTANYVATIANLDPAGRTYADAFMRVVLPVGVYYDETVGATAQSATTPIGQAVPQVGDDVRVSIETVTDDEGEHQVVVFHFDDIASARTAGEAKHAGAITGGFRYNIPVTVQPQAYTGAGNAVPARTFASTLDPEFSDVALGYYYTHFGPDVYDFDPGRREISRYTATSVVTAAGGLLIGKLVRAEGASAWSTFATVETPGIAEWQVYVTNVLPSEITDTVLFDRLPVVGDGRDSQFAVTLASAVTGVPEGATIEYSIDATSAETGTWTADSEGATAFRILIPRLAASTEVTLEYRTTVPESVHAEHVATNDVTATGSYLGAPRHFFSTPASISPVAAPAIDLVKKTNGVEYSSAPGADLEVGADVVWTYTVTNTGNTTLDEIAVSDSFLAGDGTDGVFEATSDESGPLEPGQSRTFTASGIAVEGQYENTATATGVAVGHDGSPLTAQPDPAIDSSWYFAEIITVPPLTPPTTPPTEAPPVETPPVETPPSEEPPAPPPADTPPALALTGSTFPLWAIAAWAVLIALGTWFTVVARIGRRRG